MVLQLDRCNLQGSARREYRHLPPNGRIFRVCHYDRCVRSEPTKNARMTGSRDVRRLGLLWATVPYRCNGVSSIWRIVLILAGLTLCTNSGLSAQMSTTLSVKDIYEKAQRWHASIRSVRVEYDYTQREIARIPAPATIMTGKWHVIFACDLRDGRRKNDRKRIETFRPEVPSPAEEIYLFDGDKAATVAFGTTAPVMTSVTITSQEGKSSQTDMDHYCHDVLQIPLTNKELVSYDILYWYPHALRDPSLKGLYCHILPKRDAVDGASCCVVEFPGRVKMWIDTKLNCALRKWERFTGDKNAPTLCRALYCV